MGWLSPSKKGREDAKWCHATPVEKWGDSKPQRTKRGQKAYDKAFSRKYDEQVAKARRGR